MTLTDYKNNRMKNAEFAEAYDEVQSEMNEIRAVIDNCIINNKNIKKNWRRCGSREVQETSTTNLNVSQSCRFEI